MKNNAKIENDLALPLSSNNVEWNLYLYKKRYKRNALNSYEMYKINGIQLFSVYSDIHLYIMKNYLNRVEICHYSSEMPKNKIGFIDLNNENNILKNSIELLEFGINNSTLFAGRTLSLHGYILECKIDGNTHMKIISTSNPIKIYKHRYSLIFNNRFEELQNPVLTLNHTCDCILFKEYCLFLTGRAESIFDLEKHYKVLAIKCLEKIQEQQLLADFENFSTYASIWPRAARFENFNAARITEFSKLPKTEKEHILKRSSISVDQNGAMVSNNPEENEKILNFICGKVLYDFNNDTYEVCYPRKINP